MGVPYACLGELAVEACYSGFRKHCVQVHGLKEDDPADSQVFLRFREMDADAAEGLGYPCGRFGREACIEDAIRNAERILQKIDQLWPTE